ncbi:hypothetical protein [Mycobacterium marinum]|uniref:Uncharacterized protein n=1 Tax=Mycobacterium marinum TaxID=1781 RepID=A0A3E2MSB4_MYCMR|nr:hypothetical protein [Mycobacterium marinum]RFZ36934.1 hypothetical protein DAVIS_03919 [Mycobacterium marinum]GJO36687.1 hypothetical protein NJB1604_00340 [Mycobacterium marinum]
MAFGSYGECFHGGAQVGNLAGQDGAGAGLSGAVFVGDGAELVVAVERGAADLGIFGRGGEHGGLA